MTCASGPPEAMPPAPPARVLRFGRFELHSDDRLLLRDGEPVVLRAKAFDLLAVLAARPGRLIAKDELLDLVWPGLVVEENNIAAQVATLRKVVGGDAVATVPGHGYRFAAEVLDVAGPAPASAADAASGGQASMAGAPARATPSAATRARDTPGVAPADGPVAPPAAVRRGAPVQSLFGRDDDRRRLHALLDGGGCVTLVGAGGVGKTVLARAVASERPAHRATWVDLAALDLGGDVAGAACRALGIATPTGAGAVRVALAAALGSGAHLLVLDNAEHVVDGVAELAAALSEAVPTLSLLVTSQLPLGIAGERVQPLDPLPLPPDDLSDDGTLAHAAVQLLVDRIRAADRRFPLDPPALPLLRRLAARLDGLPLALEMAAAVVPLLGLAGVLDALDRRFDVLRRGHRDAPDRHRTLRAALDWSHGLLQPLEQRALRRVGVFAGTFPLELAVAVATDPDDDRWDVVDAFAALVDRSLVVSLHTDPPRYRLTETVRAFALERLAAASDGESTAVRAAASRALAGRLREAAPDAVETTTADLASVPEALAWARDRDPAAALALALGAAHAATWTAWRGEAMRWLESCEPLLASGVSRSTEAAWWRELARQQTFVRGARAVEAARRAAAIEREEGNDEGLFWSLVPLLRSRTVDAFEFDVCRAEAEALLARHPEWPARARVVFSGSLALEHRRRGDFATALRHQQAEASEARRAGLHQAARNAEGNVAATLVGLGRHKEALALLDAQRPEAADPAAEDAIGAHDRVQRLNALIGLGRFDDAIALAPDVVRWCRRFDVLDAVQVLALLQALRGRLREAARLLGHHRAALARSGADRPDDAHAPWRQAERLAVAGLGAATAEAEAERGTAFGPAEADRTMTDLGA